MRPQDHKNFKYGNYISDAINQVANNIQLFDSEKENLEYNLDCNCDNYYSNVTGIYDCEFTPLLNGKNRTHSTFLVKASGDSMEKAGIKDNDILLVNSSVQAVNNSIIVCEINNVMAIKRIKFLGRNFILFSENEKYPSIIVKWSDNFTIWGVVVSVLTSM